MAEQIHGTFTRGDRTRVARSAAEATRLAWDGWRRTGNADPEVIPETAPSAPPRNGAGSGLEAWKEYAGWAGVAIPDGATRDEVIATLEDAGKPV